MLRTFILVNPGKNGYCKFRLTVCEDITITENTFSYESYSAGFSSPSPDFPQEIKSTVNPAISITGKNLLAPSYFFLSPNHTGLNITRVEDKIKKVGTTTEGVWQVMADGIPLKKGVYTIGITCTDAKALERAMIIQKDAKGETKKAETFGIQGSKNEKLSYTFTVSDALSYITVNQGISAGVSIDTLYTIQAEKGYVSTDYEPYAEQTTNIPYTLNAIPVDSGGNYTDPDGQQWICDEIDFERGVYIQRIYRVDLTEKMTKWNTWGANAKTEGITGFYSYWQHADLPIPVRNKIVSNIFVHQENAWGGLYVGSTINLVDKYIICSINTDSLENIDNDEEAIKSFVKLITEKKAYVLFAINPIEIPLTEDQIASYKALHTYNGTAIIESEADLSLSYVANPKKYIDKKFAELSQAIIASASEAE